MPNRTRASHVRTSAPVYRSMGKKDAKGSAAAHKLDPTDIGLPPGPYVTIAEAAELLRVDPKTVRSRIKSGDLEAHRHGRRILISLAAIMRLIERGRL